MTWPIYHKPKNKGITFKISRESSAALMELDWVRQEESLNSLKMDFSLLLLPSSDESDDPTIQNVLQETLALPRPWTVEFRILSELDFGTQNPVQVLKLLENIHYCQFTCSSTITPAWIISAVLRHATTWTKLQELRIVGISFQPLDLRELHHCVGLDKVPHLCVKVSPDLHVGTFPPPECLKHIQSLSLAWNESGIEGWRILVQQVKTLPNLVNLSLSLPSMTIVENDEATIDFSEPPLAAFSEWLGSSACPLLRLELRDSSHGSLSLQWVLPHLETNPTLEVLSIYHQRDFDMSVLLQAVTANAFIRRLEFPRCNNSSQETLERMLQWQKSSSMKARYIMIHFDEFRPHRVRENVVGKIHQVSRMHGIMQGLVPRRPRAVDSSTMDRHADISFLSSWPLALESLAGRPPFSSDTLQHHHDQGNSIAEMQQYCLTALYAAIQMLCGHAAFSWEHSIKSE